MAKWARRAAERRTSPRRPQRTSSSRWRCAQFSHVCPFFRTNKMRGSGEWKGAIHKNVRTWAYGQPLNLADEATISPGTGRHIARHRGHCAHLGVVRLSGALGVITCWANTRVGLIVNVMHSAHTAREPRKLDRADGCKFGGGAQVGGGSTFSISTFASSLCCAVKAPLF